MTRLRQGATPGAAQPKRERHRWPEDGTKLAQKTERECLRGCGAIKVTFHQGGRSWMKYCRDGEWSDRAPVCEPAAPGVAEGEVGSVMGGTP